MHSARTLSVLTIALTAVAVASFSTNPILQLSSLHSRHIVRNVVSLLFSPKVPPGTQSN